MYVSYPLMFWLVKIAIYIYCYLYISIYKICYVYIYYL